jgi:hypothetical protein
VVAGDGAGEQVVGQPEALQVLDDHPVVLVGVSRVVSPPLGLHQDRGAVLVGAETISTSFPLIRMNREKTSDGTPKPET